MVNTDMVFGCSTFLLLAMLPMAVVVAGAAAQRTHACLRGRPTDGIIRHAGFVSGDADLQNPEMDITTQVLMSTQGGGTCPAAAPLHLGQRS